MPVRTHISTPEIRHEEASSGPCLRWLAGLVVAFTALGVVLTHCGQLFIH